MDKNQLLPSQKAAEAVTIKRPKRRPWIGPVIWTLLSAALFALLAVVQNYLGASQGAARQRHTAVPQVIDVNNEIYFILSVLELPSPWAQTYAASGEQDSTLILVQAEAHGASRKVYAIGKRLQRALWSHYRRGEGWPVAKLKKIVAVRIARMHGNEKEVWDAGALFISEDVKIQWTMLRALAPLPARVRLPPPNSR